MIVIVDFHIFIIGFMGAGLVPARLQTIEQDCGLNTRSGRHKTGPYMAGVNIYGRALKNSTFAQHLTNLPIYDTHHNNIHRRGALWG